MFDNERLARLIERLHQADSGAGAGREQRVRDLLLAEIAALADALETTAAGAPDRIAVTGGDPAADSGEEALAALLTDAYLYTDGRGIIRRINKQVTTLLGRSALGIVGKPLTVFVAAEDRREFRRALLGMSEARGPLEWSVLFAPRGREPFAADIVAAPDHVEGRLRGIRWLVRTAGTERARRRGTIAAAAPFEERDQPGVFARFLARASALLSASLDDAATMRGIGRLALPILGDWCFIDRVDPSGRHERVTVSYLSTESDELEPVLLANPVSASAESGPLGDVLRTRRPLLERFVEPGFLDRVADDPEYRSALARLAPRSWMVVPLVARGRVLGLMHFLMAGSGRRHSAAQLALAVDLGNRLALAVDNAQLFRLTQQASEAKSAFLASISHELRTPLTAIIGYSELLIDGILGPLSEVQRQQLQRIAKSSDHLVSLVEQLLGFARLEAGQEALRCDHTDVGAVVVEAMEMVAPMADAKAIELRAALPERTPQLYTDPQKLRQVLINLLANAVKFTDCGEVTVIVEKQDATVALTVQDSGIGIPANQLEHIFEPFARAGSPQDASRGGGTGLGLAIVRHLVHLLGGKIDVQSEVGFGSRFTVTIPAVVLSDRSLDLRVATEVPLPSKPAPAAPAASAVKNAAELT